MLEDNSQKTALLLVDHGSTVTESNNVLVQIAEEIKKRRPDLIVHVAHMELAPPTIAEGFAACANDGATRVVVHPYMLVPGRHATKDVPKLVRQAATDYPSVSFKVTPPLGLHDKLCDVVLERAGL